jgi:hypothetical protein
MNQLDAVSVAIDDEMIEKVEAVMVGDFYPRQQVRRTGWRFAADVRIVKDIVRLSETAAFLRIEGCDGLWSFADWESAEEFLVDEARKTARLRVSR